MAAKKQNRVKEARDLLQLARRQAEQAAIHSWDPAEPAECVTKCFYSYENALTAAAAALGKTFTTQHQEKAELAKRLADEKKLQTDISGLLVTLNSLRKNVQYGGPGQELAGTDLDDLVMELETFLDEVDAVITSTEKD
jgi:hypothetical protein